MMNAISRFQKPMQPADMEEDFGDSNAVLGNPAFTEVAFWAKNHVLGTVHFVCGIPADLYMGVQHA